MLISMYIYVMRVDGEWGGRNNCDSVAMWAPASTAQKDKKNYGAEKLINSGLFFLVKLGCKVVSQGWHLHILHIFHFMRAYRATMGKARTHVLEPFVARLLPHHAVRNASSTLRRPVRPAAAQ